MPYTVLADLQRAAGGNQRLLELTDINGDGDQPTIDATILQAQTSAEQWIHSYAQKRFAVPFASPAPAEIVQLAARETIYRLLGARGMVPDRPKEQHDEDMMWLQDLAKGLVSPGVEPQPPKSTAVVPQILDRPDDDPFARNSFRGFW